MKNSPEMEKSVVIVDGDLHNAETIINELDTVIQNTGNLDLSRTLNEINGSLDLLRRLFNKQQAGEDI